MDAQVTAADPMNPKCQSKTWMSVHLGTHSSVDALLGTLSEDALVAPYSEKIIRMPKLFSLSRRLITVDLVRMKAPRTPLHEVQEKGKSAGLMVCPPEVALQLLRQYPELVDGKKLVVMTNPLRIPHARATGEGGTISRIFTLHRYLDIRRLGTDCGQDDFYFPPNAEFVFVKPSQ